jgi:hypothetical protein
MTVKLPTTVLARILSELEKSLPIEVIAKAEIPIHGDTLHSLRDLIQQLPDDQFKAWALNELKGSENGSQSSQ